MKKAMIWVLALLLAAALPLAGCELLDQPFPEETETDSSILIDPEKTGANGNIPSEPDGTEAATESDTPTAPADPYVGLTEEERCDFYKTLSAISENLRSRIESELKHI